MYVKAMVTRCDFTNREYDGEVEGVHVVSQGASGRWCCIMDMGPEEVVRQRISDNVLTHEQAVSFVENKGDSGWVEF